MRKRTSEQTTPSVSSSKGSFKIAKSPPKRPKAEQTMTYGVPCIIRYYQVADFKLWHVITKDDKNDAFVKNIVDEIRSDADCTLRRKYNFKGDVTRRVSLSQDEPMRNGRKSYERKFLLQCIDEDAYDFPEEEYEKDLATARELQKVRFASSFCL